MGYTEITEKHSEIHRGSYDKHSSMNRRSAKPNLGVLVSWWPRTLVNERMKELKMNQINNEAIMKNEIEDILPQSRTSGTRVH